MSEPLGPADAARIPRFAGPPTFARLPRRDQVETIDVAIVGVPFDSGVTYRPGARFGPSAVRAGSRLLRPYHPALEVWPFAVQQVADCGDIACNPFDIGEAIAEIETAADELHGAGARVMALGGDHTIALPLLRSAAKRHGPVALVHFDAHLDTWDTYFGARYTHGTPFRRAVEEGILDTDKLTHVGIRGPLYAAEDLAEDARLGFGIITTMDVQEQGLREIINRIVDRVGDAPVYVSVDIDVLDPAFAPATGTPEAGGLSSRELLAMLRGLVGRHLVAADLVEVAPAYDHAEITAIAGAHLAYELVAAMECKRDV